MSTTKKLDGVEVSEQEFREKAEHTEKNKKIVEIKPNEFKTLSKMKG